MKSIILSIHSKHAEKIYSGEKQYEFRKTVPMSSGKARCPIITGMKVYFYETKPTGLITGEVIVKQCILGVPSGVWQLVQKHSGRDYAAFFEYFEYSKTAYALDVRNFKKYDTPLPLSHFNLNRAPQSWCYVK